MTESNVPPPIPPTDTPVVGYATPVAGYDGPPPTKDETNMGLLMMILAIVTGWLGPLIIWLMKKSESRFLDAQGKEVLNYEITIFLAFIACFILTFVLIGLFLLPIVILANLILLIMGAINVSKGNFHRFPFALRLLK